MAVEVTHTYLPDGRIITTYTTVSDKPNQLVTTPQEIQRMANVGGGVLSEIGKTAVIKPSAEFIKEQPAELTPKLAQGESGYYIKSSTGVYVPVSKGVADLINANNAKLSQNISQNYAAAAAITSAKDVGPAPVKADVKYFNLPQRYTSSATLEEQLKSNKMYKEVSISPETVGWERWSTMENIRLSSGYQTAFMLKKMITWESLFATGGAGISLLAGKYPEYQAWLQSRWLAEQRVETLQMSKFGENIVWKDTMAVDINKQQFMEAKAMEIIPPAAMTIAPAFIGKVFSAATAAGSISIKAAQAWSKIGLVVTGAGVAYGTSEAVAGISEGTPAGYYRASAGIVTSGFSAYGLKQMWATSFPKRYYLEGYRMEHQMYSGEEETLRGEFTKGYQEIQRYRYGSPTEKITKQTMADEAVYLKIKGYKINQLVEELGGGETVNEFEYNIKFRIAEREGLLKPLLQNIKEVEVFYPKFMKGETIRNLGISYYDTSFGKPDIVNEFTFSKTGMSRVINIEAWENSFRSIEQNIPISKVYVKGTGYDIFKDEFRALIRNMVADKNIVITEAEHHSFFLEPELRKPFTSFASTGKETPLWKTTGDYYGYAPKKDMFDFLGVKDLTKVGGIAQIDLFKGKTVSSDTVLAERLKIYQKPLYDFTYYDKPVPVLANYPPETSLTLIPPAIAGSAKPTILTGMNLGTLKGEAGLGLKPELKTFTQPKLDIRYEPSLKQQPFIQPKIMPELKTEPALELRAEPALTLQPKLQPMLQPKLELEPKLEMRLQARLQMQMKPQLMLWFKEKPTNIFREEEGKDWFRGGKKDIFGIGKKDKLGKSGWVIQPKSDWLSRIQSQIMYGSATNVPDKPKYRRAFKKEFMSPMGLFAGSMPTVEMIKYQKIKL